MLSPKILAYGLICWLAIICLLPSVGRSGLAETSVLGADVVQLTDKETAWLRSHQELVIAPSPDFPPIEFFDRNGRFSGITADYLRILERKLGVKFRVKRFANWREIEEHTKSGEVDVWGAATETTERSAYMRFTKPYLDFPALIIVRKNTHRNLTLDRLMGLKVVSISQHVTDQFLNEHYPGLIKVLVSDVQAGLKMVSFGDADAIVLNAAPASYYIGELGLTNLTIAGQSDITWPLSLASRRDWPILSSILRKALDSISPEERNAISKKWVNLQQEGTVSHRTFVWTVLVSIAIAAAVILLFIFVNRSLRRMVMQRTTELRVELEERKRIEGKLLKSEERLTRFFEAAFEGLFFHSRGVVVDANPAVKEILGYTPDAVIGRNLMDFIAPDSQSLVLKRMQAGDTGTYEVMGIRSDGEPHPLEVRARSVDMGDTPARVVGFRDITERKQAEHELRRYQDELVTKTESLEAIRSIADTLYRSLDLQTVADQAVTAMMRRNNSPSVSMYLLNQEDGCLEMYFSRGFAEALLKKSGKLPLRGSLSGLAVETRNIAVSPDISSDSRLEPVVQKALMDCGYRGAVSVPLLAEERVLGTLNLLYRSPYESSPVTDQELLVIGQTVGLAISHAVNLAQLREEMAVRRSAEEALRQLNADLEQRVIERTAELAEAKERAEAADYLKSAFLATMSHELRTPLNSIIGFTGVILQGMAGPLNDEQKKQMEMVKTSASHLLALINDVLDLSKIEAGQLTLACHDFDLCASLEKVVKTVQPLVDSKGLSLVVNMDTKKAVIRSDQRRVEQILLNLLSNAIKFTDIGVISVNCGISENAVRVSVSDTGIGIKHEDLANLFKPFRQLEAGLTRRFEGTGLGLSICKKLIVQLGGEIRVDSTMGKGSTFSFTLPIAGGIS